MTRENRPQLPPLLSSEAHKGAAGRVLCLCGSRTMPGAAIMVVRAALRSGAGRVTLGCMDSELLGVVPVVSPETVLLELAGARGGLEALPTSPPAPSFHSRVIGSGLGTTRRARTLVSACLEDDFKAPQVFDADALNLLRGEPERFRRVDGPVILTPHGGEARGLLGREVPANEAGRVAFARELAERSGGLCVLKGAHTVVAGREHSFVNDTGNPGLATAGSGDVLGGILGAFLARTSREGSTYSVFEAVCAAVRLHGLAGDFAAQALGERAMIASDLIEHLPMAQRDYA